MTWPGRPRSNSIVGEIGNDVCSLVEACAAAELEAADRDRFEFRFRRTRYVVRAKHGFLIAFEVNGEEVVAARARRLLDDGHWQTQ